MKKKLGLAHLFKSEYRLMIWITSCRKDPWWRFSRRWSSLGSSRTKTRSSLSGPQFRWSWGWGRRCRTSSSCSPSERRRSSTCWCRSWPRRTSGGWCRCRSWRSWRERYRSPYAGEKPGMNRLLYCLRGHHVIERASACGSKSSWFYLG